MPKGKRLPRAGTRLPSLRGAVVIDDMYGSPRFRAWPRARGPNRHPSNIFWTNWLKGVTFLWRYQPAEFQAQAIAATKGTPWMARDPFISAFRGRAWSFTDQHGRTYMPLVAVEAVSQSLDAIGQLAGNMLFRLGNRWAPIAPPSAAGQVLVSGEDDELPAWGPAPASATPFDAWSPITPPETPDTEDYEFASPGSGLPTGWTDWDHGNAGTVDVDDAGLKLTQPSHAGRAWSGVCRALPAGDFTVWTRLGLSYVVGGNNWGGLAIFQNPSSASGDFYTFNVRHTTAAGVLQISRWDAYNGSRTTIVSDVNLAAGQNAVYLRIRRASAQYAFDVSLDGLNWLQLTNTALSFTPSHFGFALDNEGTGRDAALRANFWRYSPSDLGITGLALGRRL